MVYGGGEGRRMRTDAANRVDEGEVAEEAAVVDVDGEGHELVSEELEDEREGSLVRAMG